MEGIISDMQCDLHMSYLKIKYDIDIKNPPDNSVDFSSKVTRQQGADNVFIIMVIPLKHFRVA